jgi:membrane protein DedA with SNARE-associated domain
VRADQLVVLSSLTSQITDTVAKHGVLAVFVVMAIDAILPASGELAMVYAGALASGAIAGAQPTLFGHALSSGLAAYVVLATAGTLGYLFGAVIGWAIGWYGGRPLLERRGRWLHLGPERMDRAERWFDRHGDQAVFLGRLTPVVRSFISIPAGVLESPLRRYVPLTLAGSAIWCFAFAAAGWALGSNWENLHQAFDKVVIALVAGTVLVVAGLLLTHRRRAVR